MSADNFCTSDPELVSLVNEGKLEYVILSHVWEEEEVTFHDRQDPSKRKDMKGWSKISRACELGRSDGWEYIWIDTCCINKSSSSELSAAINSMYSYYREAELCSAYLSDVRSDLSERSFAFRACKRFTRGWTLQQLIALKRVVFFTKDWAKIGTKADLRGAYSLMGIFDIFMSTIYGKGEHAFFRLHEEILKVSSDQTIFAWNDYEPAERGHSHHNRYSSQPYSITNMGLLIHLPLLRVIRVYVIYRLRRAKRT
ncbi:heterokaryon incompatibility protein-domain-containing protein [Rhodocollybia butyracea]|uniref:Heterokaryon incompatibility protein-domain-containing protein n=1 Tax=Rhodocollybia butyracea TaxID=206335 RepID=A0A9P5PG88_9AGAR|nr:heterokaryon incompatibility protein-domain-containing protein [Rhodocollybia butyracea]